MNIEDIKEKIEKATIALASVNNEGNPHNIAIMYAKIKNNKIIITDNYMKTTVENIQNNQNVSLVFWEEEKGWRIDGKAEYQNSGDWLDFVKSLKENEELPAKGAVIINIEKVEEIN